jgi:hypothetical protein
MANPTSTFTHTNEPLIQPSSEQKLQHVLQIPSNIWGPGGWKYLEQFFQWGESFPGGDNTGDASSKSSSPLVLSDDQAIRRLYYVHHFLPGKGCKVKLGAYIRDEATSPKPGEDRGRWLWTLHNSINERLGKRIVSEEEAKRQWYKTTLSQPNISDATRMAMLRFLATMRYESYYCQEYAQQSDAPADLVASGPADWMSSFNHVFQNQSLPVSDATTLLTNVAFYQMRCILVVAVVQKTAPEQNDPKDWAIHTRVVIYDAIRDELVSVQHNHYEFKAMYFHSSHESHLVELVRYGEGKEEDEEEGKREESLFVQTAAFANQKEALLQTIRGADMLVHPSEPNDPGNGFKIDLTARTNLLILNTGEQRHLNNGSMTMMTSRNRLRSYLSSSSDELHFVARDPVAPFTPNAAWAYLSIDTSQTPMVQYLLDDELMLPHVILYHRDRQQFDLVLLPALKRTYTDGEPPVQTNDDKRVQINSNVASSSSTFPSRSSTSMETKIMQIIRQAAK